LSKAIATIQVDESLQAPMFNYSTFATTTKGMLFPYCAIFTNVFGILLYT